MAESSEPRYVEMEAESVEEAIRQGLEQLGLTRAEVAVEVLDEGGRGFIGIGGRAARVRLTEGDEPYRPQSEIIEPSAEEKVEEQPVAPAQSQKSEAQDADVSIASEVLEELLGHLKVKAEINISRAEPARDEHESPWVLDIQGNDLGVLIGRRGETLNALQYITRLIVNREVQRRANIVIDVESYKTRREATLRGLAQRMAEQARQQGRMVTLEPMPPNERRIIHIALRDDPSVVTLSEGMGDGRKVTIRPVATED